MSKKLKYLGGLSAIAEAITYILGFILFFGVLDTSGITSAQERLQFFINNRDIYILGYFIIGIAFSFILIILVQSIDQYFKSHAPYLMKFVSGVGYTWSVLVMASSLIFISSLEILETYFLEDPSQALIIHRTTNVIVDALGGGIEIVGAIWVLTISFVGLTVRKFSAWLHYLGILVGLAGTLTLLSSLSYFSQSTFFQSTQAIFGLGQIVWFVWLGISFLTRKEI
ncbi:DUF4386 family protein [Fulvivirga sp. RKSG066]|uniref:DUF4386 family protein n=1 Tax=Fulvivirga aurantia TaxID=2529383 RepID=UPI0012BBEDD1|nr:DUF4386 family protein [Fulvivirga aurantia]MTI22254.1 DUF4386 family protein [Fulvivirga aurantia]